MKYFYRLSISILIIALISTTAKAQTNVQDSLALVDIYNATSGSNWTIKNNWLTKQPVTKWYGITVSVNRVIGIALIRNNLTGNLPVSIGNLTYLNTIHLEQNLLTGSIPQIIGNLSFLQLLSLSGNKFTGSIPSVLGNLPLLSYVDLSFNSLSGNIPSELGSINSLESLFLYSNSLTGSIPVSLGNLSSLLYLLLDYNHLTDSIPASIGNLYSLKTLSLSNNGISGTIPSSIGNLSSLAKLDVNSNQLTGSIPSSIGNLTKLNNLSLQYNHLTGAIPNSINNLSGLTTLNLNNNQLSGDIPIGLINISGLANFPLYNNNFTFAGMEAIANNALYSPQGEVMVKQKGNTIYVSVGGTPSNNTFQWYRNSKLVATISSDSTYTITSTGNYWVVATNSVASQLTLHSDTAIVTSLPIDYISLKAKPEYGKTMLEWKTTNEISTKYFVVEKSLNGKDFSNIVTLNALESGNNNYSFIDNVSGIETSILYYRIQSIDKDGIVQFSNIASVSLETANNLVAIYPNPLKGDKLTINGNQISSINVCTINGKAITTVNYNGIKNSQLNLNNLIPGIYVVSIKQQDGTFKNIRLIRE